MTKEDKPKGNILLKGVRLSFTKSLWEKKQINGEGEPKHNCSFLIDPESDTYKQVDALITEVAKDKWGAKASAILAELKKKDRVCLKDGNDNSYDGYEGMFFISASSDIRPKIIDRDKTPLDSSDGKPYAGCFVNGSINIWAMDNKYGKRICASLRGVQFVSDGDAFSGFAPASDDEFEDLSEGADADDVA